MKIVMSAIGLMIHCMSAVVGGLLHGVGYMVGTLQRDSHAKPTNVIQAKSVTTRPAMAVKIEKPVQLTVVTDQSAVGAPAAEVAKMLVYPKASEAKTMQKEPFRVAERVQTAQLCGRDGIQLGVMWLYLYPDHRIAKRVFKVTDNQLAKALKWDRRYMPDVKFDPVAGFQGIMEEMYKECSALLNKPGVAGRGKAQTETKVEVVTRPTVALTAKPAVPAPVVHTATVMEQPAAHATTVAMPMSQRAVNGETYIGRVTMAGMTTKGVGKGAYQTFCLTIHDGTRETPLVGAELQRQCGDLGIKPGDGVKVVFMGKQQVEIPDASYPSGKRFSNKNLYQVTRQES
jgi:hypothetical protein